MKDNPLCSRPPSERGEELNSTRLPSQRANNQRWDLRVRCPTQLRAAAKVECGVVSHACTWHMHRYTGRQCDNIHNRHCKRYGQVHRNGVWVLSQDGTVRASSWRSVVCSVRFVSLFVWVVTYAPLLQLRIRTLQYCMKARKSQGGGSTGEAKRPFVLSSYHSVPMQSRIAAAAASNHHQTADSE